jgi:type VI protein secretion system component Hcp
MGNVTVSGIQNVNGMERITLNYQTIEVTWTDGGKTATDDWEAR